MIGVSRQTVHAIENGKIRSFNRPGSEDSPGLFGIFAGNAAPDNQPDGQIFAEIVPHPTAEHLDFILHAE